MFNRSQVLNCPETFPFPFPPYTIQNQFMCALYSVIENRKIGIFESPTGTGKTLSLMCSALKWLTDHNELNRIDLLNQIAALQLDVKLDDEKNSKATNWLDGQFDTIQKKENLRKLQKQSESIEAHDKNIQEMREKWLKQQKTNKTSKRKFASRKQNSADDLSVIEEKTDSVKNDEDDDFLIEEIEEVELDMDQETKNEFNLNDTKIFFCSRTHSQLAQVVNELKKTIYAQSVRVVSLASRQQYCINPTVRSLKSNSLINERCLEMKKGKTKSKCCQPQATQSDKMGRTMKKSKVIQTKTESCPFYAKMPIETVSQTALYNANGIMDIEELIEEAKIEKGCPYYATRQAAKDAQIIMLPYQMLLHKKTRDQLDISIKNSVIIIDEAHNLLDTIASMHSAEITLDQLQRTHQQLTAYKAKYFSRFSTKSLLRINQLISIANRFAKFLLEPSLKTKTNTLNAHQQTEFTSKMINVHELLDDANISVGNLNEILIFCEETRLAQKIGGFTMRYANEEVIVSEKEIKPKQSHASYLKQLSEQQMNKTKMGKEKVKEVPVQPEPEIKKSNEINSLGLASVLRLFLAFLECLLDSSTDGRILISKHRSLQSKSFIKYLLLNSSGPFEEILNECRTVIVAGGTMQPTTEFTTQLFQAYAVRIEEHFFGHVVASDAVLPLVVSKGPRNSSFLFNFSNRSNTEMLADLSMVIQNICNVIPAGIVCFFGSYDYMEQFHKYLTESKALEKIQIKKKVFKEPRAGGQQTEKMLLDYSNAIKNCRHSTCETQTGALMMSVIGGKLSEGLNFSDDLGRCVCVIGLPFPNKMNPELAEKMKYLDKIAIEQKKCETNGSSFASAEYYENLCMKAVNQCIGRAIRHINDYATVLLIDERYKQERIQQKLPQWIRKSVQCPGSFGSVQGALVKFFKLKKQH